MLVASIFAHIAMGILLALICGLYYIIGEMKHKVFVELLIGTAGGGGLLFALEKYIPIEDAVIRMYSIGSCITSFVLAFIGFLYIVAIIIKDKDDTDILRIRDILLDQRGWVNNYYESRKKEIDSRLNYYQLKLREEEIDKRESCVQIKEAYVNQEYEKLGQLTDKKLKLELPDNKYVVLTEEYIYAMPSYIADIVRCIEDIEFMTKELMSIPTDEITISKLNSYFMSLAVYISCDIFGGNSNDVRIHFRRYDNVNKVYTKIVSVTGKQVDKKNMTDIPADKDNMINQSYSCRRALIKSINSEFDYKSKNHSVWQDYLTYAFYDIQYGEYPAFSFGISIKNPARHKKVLQLLNYFRIEDYLQRNLEQLNEHINLIEVYYNNGGEVNG